MAFFKFVTPERIEYLRQGGPYIILAYVLLTLFGIKKIQQDPRFILIYAKIVEFAKTKRAQILARRGMYGMGAFLAIFCYTWRQICTETKPNPRIKLDSRPFLAFGGGFFLYPFYWGVTGYLRDNFETSNVRASGLSAGSFALGTLLSSSDD